MNRKLRRFLRSLWYRVRKPPTDPAPPPREPRRFLGDYLMNEPTGPGSAQLISIPQPQPVEYPFRPTLKGHAPPKLAMDYAPGAGIGDWGEFASTDGVGWLGFPFLSQLMQRPEFRNMVTVTAQEMTRKWFCWTYTGKDTNWPERRRQLEEAFDIFKVRQLFREVAEHDGAFGRGHIYIDLNTFDNDDENKKPLVVEPEKIKKGDLAGFRTVEPVWVYPLEYDAANPLNPTFYKPQHWNVSGKTVHHTRLMTFVSREVPDLLKPAYSFAGLSLIQMALPYVNNWLRTRQSVSDLVHAFTVWVLSTRLSDTMDQAGAMAMERRAQIFNAYRDNKGLFVLDKDSETFANVSAQIAGLHELQAQAQEQMASVSQTPLVKLLGITPSGLNASSDGEIRCYYDTISAKQEHLYRDHLIKVLRIVQLHLWGKIDDDIGISFTPLWQLDEAAQAAVRKTNADTAAVYIEAGVVGQEEVREIISSEEDSPYSGLDPDKLPEPPDLEEDPDDSGDPAKSAEPREEEREGV